jgi:hypothetical protein
MTITAQNSYGTVVIESISPLKRMLKGNGFEREIELIPRHEKFDYRWGAYDPAQRSIFNFWSGSRIVVDDNYIDFNSIDELRSYFSVIESGLDMVANNDGWVVGYRRSEKRGDQINISVYRVTVKGETPQKVINKRYGSVNVEIVKGTYSLAIDEN